MRPSAGLRMTLLESIGLRATFVTFYPAVALAKFRAEAAVSQGATFYFTLHDPSRPRTAS
jgi:hypothetical protein